ncbi:MFS transporter [Kitasatospora sp. NBC_01266]|uniref:MFS transporter n=1 Tax=Kitasatospora sp. NBC_01266 TaxID=2903572 RepID=UPI002E345688|nr:MFS transporter [Kitasatospora sp. NBC_01266]
MRVPGERALLAGMAIDSVGSGMYVPFSLVFFRHVTGLPLPLIGAVLTVTGFVAMAALPLVGTAVDRFGARRLQLGLYVVRGLGFAAYPFAGSLPAFAAVALLTSIGDRGFPVAQQARIGELARGADVERLQAIARSLSNAGLGAGTLLASLIIGVLGDRGFTAAAWLNSASFFAAALLARRVPAVVQGFGSALRRRAAANGAGADCGYRAVLADRRYLGLTSANFLIAVGYSALSVLLPVFAVSCLGAPQSLVGVAFVVNTVLCALAGVPVARLARRFGSRTRTAAVGAGLFAASAVGQVVLGTVRPHLLPVVLGGLLILVVVATMGELVHNPSASALATSAAPPALRGRYQATYQLSWSLAKTVAPSLFTLLLAVDARLPWLLVAVAALAGGGMLLRLGRRLPAEVDRPAPATQVARTAPVAVGTPGSAAITSVPTTSVPITSVPTTSVPTTSALTTDAAPRLPV